MKKRLSVIVPTYQCEDFLQECVDSVLSQLPDDCELILADDGSEDVTLEMLRAYTGRQSNLKTLYLPHGGASSARNAGLAAAEGEYVTFLDCDDCLQPGFLQPALQLAERNADLLIFGIEWMPLSGEKEEWTLRNRVFPGISDFADEYIRTRASLIYSNCNKFYRRSILNKLSLRFQTDVSFGEDRLFNYSYLQGCETVQTSSLLMLRYIQRKEESMSTRHVPCYFRQAMLLHKAKTDCFLSLSEGTTEEEQRHFKACDLAAEIAQTVRRFPSHPEEEEENMPEVNELIFRLLPVEPLKKELAACGIENPDCWYQTQEGQSVVLSQIREAVL